MLGTGGVKVPPHDDPITPDGDVVWRTDDCSGTGGGASERWPIPSWQAAAPGRAEQPDAHGARRGEPHGRPGLRDADAGFVRPGLRMARRRRRQHDRALPRRRAGHRPWGAARRRCRGSDPPRSGALPPGGRPGGVPARCSTTSPSGTTTPIRRAVARPGWATTRPPVSASSTSPPSIRRAGLPTAPRHPSRAGERSSPPSPAERGRERPWERRRPGPESGPCWCCWSTPPGIRTQNLRIKSPMLCH